MTKRRFVILDRDGTINVDTNYLSDPDHFSFLPGAVMGLKNMSNMGLGLIIVTNQSGIGRGMFDEAQLAKIHLRMRELLAGHSIELSGIYYCPHHPDDKCSCRKPETGLIQRAVLDHGFKPSEAFVIGDKPADIQLGKAIKATTFLVLTGYGVKSSQEQNLRPDYIVKDLNSASSIIADLIRDNKNTENIHV